MVSYFVPRGRFLIKAGNVRHSHHQKQQQQQYQQGKWAVFHHLRQTWRGTQKTPANNTTLIRQNSNQCQSANKLHAQKTRPPSVWMRWTGFLMRWAPIGIFFFGVVEWQLHKRKCQRNQLPRTASEFQAKVYCSLPLRIMSRCWGWLAACYVPVSFRPYLYGWFSSTFKVNVDEALYPDYKYYKSLSEFFTRPLRDGVRLIDPDAPIVSPADGRVLHFGTAGNAYIEQVKGINYSVQSFIGQPTWNEQAAPTSEANPDYIESIKEKHDGTTTLYQCVIYLAPGDYHRFHSPAEWQPIVRRHFDGELLSVNPRVATWLPGLFCLNERVLYVGKWQHGFFSYTAVGATNVGSVEICMDEKLKTNRWVGFKMGTHKKLKDYEEMPWPENVDMKRGDLIGRFNMGSTIVLLFEAPLNFKFNLQEGQTVRVGQPLGYIEKQ